MRNHQVQCCRTRTDELEMRESSKAPPDMKMAGSTLTCQSRGVPPDHEARRQVKVQEKTEEYCWKEGAVRGPQTKSRQNSEMWGRPHSHARDTAAHQRHNATVQETHRNNKNERSRSHQSSKTSRRLRRQ